MRRVERTVMWQSLDGPGSEWCALSREGEGWMVEGTVVVALDERPLKVGYEIRCDGAWWTRRVDVEVADGPAVRAMRLEADDERRWWRDGEEISAVRGLHDIDLGVTPATNTLPIRRLMPGIGEAPGVTAVWVRFPELEIEPLPQRYVRLGQNLYRYESNGGAFTADITVDNLGLIVRYERFWERVAAFDGSTEGSPDAALTPSSPRR